MNLRTQTICLALGATAMLSFELRAQAVGAPAALGGYLKPDTPVKGQVVIVVPPAEIETYLKTFQEAARKDPQWFHEYSQTAKPGVPLPYHEKLGLTKEEYDQYSKLWDQRELKPVPEGEVTVRLEQLEPNEWVIRVIGKLDTRVGAVATKVSLLKYNAQDDTFTSPNGPMTRIEDISADPRSTLGEWTGHEWKFEEIDSLGKTKENFAVGKLAGGKYGLLVYRLQAITDSGRLIDDVNLVIRYPLAAK